MGKFFNKYIITILGFFVFWIGLLPIFISKALPVVCENLTYNTEYNFTLENPRVVLSVLPTARIKADSFKVTKKKSKDKLEIDGLNVKLRLLPLISGRVHINEIVVSDFIMEAKLGKNPTLDKNFLSDISKTKVSVDSFKIDRLFVGLSEAGSKKLAVYKANGIKYRKNSRYIKLLFDSEINVEGKVSSAKVNLFLPRNNDVTKSIVDINIENLDLAPIGDFLINYLPSDLVDVRGIVDIKTNKNHLSGTLKNVAIVMKDEGNSMIFPELLEISSDF